MTEIEKMKRYIERAKVPEQSSSAYDILLGELHAMGNFAHSDLYSALLLLFEYGRAKGYRAAKAERRATA